MKRTSIANAKAHLAELVRDAQRLRRRTIILRKGKPVAAIVPIDEEEPAPALSLAEIDSLFAPLGAADPDASAVADLFAERR